MTDETRPWWEWNTISQPDGMTIYDPDGFRDGKPTVVTYDEFLRARNECTMVWRETPVAETTLE